MWEELYERHYQELLRYCTRMCGDGELAKDLVQDTFLKALQSGMDFEEMGASQRRAWLYRTLKNGIYDRYRRAVVEENYINSLDEAGIVWEPGIQEIENQLLLNVLSPEDRALFHLRFVEGYNATELAEMFGMPPGTIRARLSRCRKQLKILLTTGGMENG